MPANPMHMFMEGRVRPIPVMAGTTTDEGNLFVWPYFKSGMNESQYMHFIGALFGGDLNETVMAELDALYPRKGDLRAVASSVVTDCSYLCGTQLSLQAHSSIADAFLYRFNHRSRCPSQSNIIPGVYHSVEMIYVWGDPGSEACLFTPEERALSLRMQLMWTNFAKDLRPDISAETFPKFENSTRLGLVLQTPHD